MNDILERLDRAQEHLALCCKEVPSIAVVLGSGYSWLGNQVEDALVVPYEEIPGFPICTNRQHPGKLIIGRLFGRRVAVLQGRVHCYEGYSAAEVAFPVRTLARWGVKQFVLTNAAGAIHPYYTEGEFMLLTDHINFLGQNPLSGPNPEALGTRFPDLSSLYDPEWRAALNRKIVRSGIPLHEGVYGAMPGPSYETPAEIRMLQVVGADAVGMSTVPEAIALGHMGCRVLAISCLTNLAAGKSQKPIRDEEITEVLDRPTARAHLIRILEEVLNVV